MKNYSRYMVLIVVILCPVICPNWVSAQNAEDKVLTNPSYFMFVRTIDGRTGPILRVGDKVVIKQKNGRPIRSKIGNVSKNFISTADGNDIDVNAIEWIRKPSVEASVIGGLAMAGGAALLITAAKGTPTFDDLGGYVFGGTALFAIGCIIVGPPKHKPAKNYVLVYVNQESAKNP